MSQPYYQADGITIYHGDCREVLPGLGGVALVCTDPPYNVGKDYGLGSCDRLAQESYRGLLGEVFAMCGRCVGPEGTLVFTPGMVNLWQVPALIAVPWKLHWRALGWHRREFAGDSFSSGPAMCWEPVVWAYRGEKPFYNRVFGHWGRDFLIVPSVKEDPMRDVHPCPKPPWVMQWLVGLFAPPLSVVLDPFMGTGTTLLAARDRGHPSIGIEIEEKFCEISAERLSQQVLAL